MRRKEERDTASPEVGRGGKKGKRDCAERVQREKTDSERKRDAIKRGLDERM